MGEKLKNWLRGATSVLQLHPDTSSKMRERFLQQSAAEALYHDWERIGNDIRTATGPEDRGTALLDALAAFDDDFIEILEESYRTQPTMQKREDL